jgi:hypothetical protein
MHVKKRLERVGVALPKPVEDAASLVLHLRFPFCPLLRRASLEGYTLRVRSKKTDFLGTISALLQLDQTPPGALPLAPGGRITLSLSPNCLQRSFLP